MLRPRRKRKYALTILVLLAALSILVTNIPQVAATTDTIGGTDSTWGSASYIIGDSIVASASGTLSSVGINVGTAAGNIRLSIYSAFSGTQFSGLLGQSASTPAITGWNDLAITGVLIVQSTTYYLVWQLSTALCKIYYDGSGNDYFTGPFTYAAFPDPTTGSNPGSNIGMKENMRMTYSAAATSTITTTTGTSVVSTTLLNTKTTTDLTIEGMWLEDASQPGQPISQVSPGQSFLVVATIKNIGRETASNYYLDVYYDSDYGRGGPDNIAPGEVQTWYVGPLTAQAGTHTTKWAVDPDNQIVEMDETNNQKELAFTVGSQTTTTTLTSSSASSTAQSTSATTITQTSSSTPSTTQLTSTSTTSSSPSSTTSTSTYSTSESTSTSTSYTTESTSTEVTSTTTTTMTSTSTSSTSGSTSTMTTSTNPIVTGIIVSVSDSPDPVARRRMVNFSVTIKNTGNIVWSSATITIKIYRPDGTLVATPKVTIKGVQPGGQYAYRISWNVPNNAPTGIWHYEAYVNYGGVLVASSTNPGNTITVK